MVVSVHKWLVRLIVGGALVCCSWQVQAQMQMQESEQQELPPPIISTPLPPLASEPQPVTEVEAEAVPDLPILSSDPMPELEPEPEPEIESVPEGVSAPTLERETTIDTLLEEPQQQPMPAVPEATPAIPTPILTPDPELEPEPTLVPVSPLESEPDLPVVQSEPVPVNEAESAPTSEAQSAQESPLESPQPAGESLPEAPPLPPLENENMPEISPPVISSSPVGEEAAPLAPVVPAVAPPLASTLPLNSDLPHDLSPYGMFMQADIVVQSVMVGLLVASILTWVIWLAKTIEISMAKRRARQAVKSLISSRSLAEAIEKAQGKKGVSARLIMAAAGEVRLSLGAVDGAGSEGMKERVTSHLARIEVRSSRVIARGTGVLASIGSVAPFIGLFGTVWGIINAFIGISQSQTTNLAVVAPGIAEALLATAMGLFAAIPAVVIYNFFVRSITAYRQMLADISAAIERLISRDLDFRLAHKKASQPVLETVGE